MHMIGKKRICLVAIPETLAYGLFSLHDLFKIFDEALPGDNPFEVLIVGADDRSFISPSGVAIQPHCGYRNVDQADVVIVSALLLPRNRLWQTGRYDDLVQWIKDLHGQGAILCSACSGVLLLAESGLYDGYEATLHWAYADAFRKNFSKVQLRLEKTLLVTGHKQRLIMSGASSSWHDLVLYLIARLVSHSASNTIAKFFLLQWHENGQAPYISFQENKNHCDGLILNAQLWLSENLSDDNPVARMIALSGLPERSFRRRFVKATGLAPTAYVQKSRIELAKQELELSNDTIDEVSYRVGYDDPAYFRRLFKRNTGLSPSKYRRKFGMIRAFMNRL